MRAFLSFLESRGTGDVAASELGEALEEDGAKVRAALVAEGVIRAAPLATTRPCEGIGCAREVREKTRAKDGSRRFLAVCTQSPRACETLHLGEAELAQEAIVLDAFVASVRRALCIEAPLATAKAASRRALAGADVPLLLGEQHDDGRSRDVFFARRPGAPELHALLADRRNAARPAMVLVPTARGIDPELLSRHGPGHVEIAALTDLLAIHGGKIAAAPRLRAVTLVATQTTAANEATEDARVKDAQRSIVCVVLPRAKRWGDVTFYGVEQEGAIGVAIDKRRRRFTAAELGLARRSGEPVRAFALLRRICDGNGVFDTRPWGGRENGKQIVSELRRALSAAFEIAESPIEAYSMRHKSWKVKFRALVMAEREIREVEREVFGRRGKRGEE